MRTADVVVVGGGVTGCSVAFHLAEQGVRDILVLERRFLAAGGTGRSVGVMRQLYLTEATSRMVLHSLRVFQRFGEVTGGDAAYVQCGALLAVGPGQREALARTVEAQRALGIDTRLVGPDDIRALDPRILMMADLITRGDSDLADLRAFRLDRFTVAPHEDGGGFSHSYLH